MGKICEGLRLFLCECLVSFGIQSSIQIFCKKFKLYTKVLMISLTNHVYVFVHNWQRTLLRNDRLYNLQMLRYAPADNASCLHTRCKFKVKKFSVLTLLQVLNNIETVHLHRNQKGRKK